jgi:hypothetical protein
MDRPILFSTEMVKAILDGRKSQTRRVCKLHSAVDHITTFDGFPYHVGLKLWVRETHTWINLANNEYDENNPEHRITDIGVPVCMVYKADGFQIPANWRPSIFMPRWASRITLEVTEVRVQRLQDISPNDVEEEGLRRVKVWADKDYWSYPTPNFGNVILKEQTFQSNAIIAYKTLWDKINGKRYPWLSNPWVWVISFKRIK